MDWEGLPPVPPGYIQVPDWYGRTVERRVYHWYRTTSADGRAVCVVTRPGVPMRHWARLWAPDNAERLAAFERKADEIFRRFGLKP